VAKVRILCQCHSIRSKYHHFNQLGVLQFLLYNCRLFVLLQHLPDRYDATVTYIFLAGTSNDGQVLFLLLILYYSFVCLWYIIADINKTFAARSQRPGYEPVDHPIACINFRYHSAVCNGAAARHPHWPADHHISFFTPSSLTRVGLYGKIVSLGPISPQKCRE